ncbi:dystrophins A:C:F:G:H [Echinococcus multilocularis]|uniref:Dystrophins A:C:F:G:H n=1 Tax=Echinococcus multilocularis TaxID=6211 RepID=A0A087VXD5_ECHMU|nr:dystrophins A:C:F:G:H [Echinococcus multilocularis]
MGDARQRRTLPSDLDFRDGKVLATQCRVFKRWVNSQLKQDVVGHEITEAVDIFRDSEALLSLAQELANRKASTSNFRPSDGISTQENAISLIERLYGHDVATAIQLACDTYQRTDSDLSASSSSMRLTLGLDTLWILAVAAGAGTGPIEDVQEASGTVRGSVGSSTSTLIGQRSKRNSLSSVLPEAEFCSTRTPLLDRWLTRQDERLLAWCQDATQSYEGVNICNYTTSWRDGLAFLAIINQQRPELFSYRFRLEKTPMQNLGLAFHLITKEFAVARLLEPEDLLSNDAVDARSVAIYLIELRSAVEIDRRRRNKPAFEIRTTAMENQAQFGTPGEPDAGVTVTVVTTSSRSSSPTASELTFCSEEASELDEVSHLEDAQLNMAEFQHKAERSLAWMLSMEERLSDNCADLKAFNDDVKVTGKAMLRDPMAVAEKADLIALEKSPIDDVKSLNETIVSRLMEARKRFNTHEDLTAHLTKHEPMFRRCLRYGQRLANLAEHVQRISNTTPSSTTGDDSDTERQLIDHLQFVQPGEVKKMLSLLQNRWTNLNRAAEAGNRFLAGCLLNRQEAVLSAVEIQLKMLEWERDRQATERFGTTVQELKSQLVANRRLENYLESGEKLAQHMQDIVILVPSETPDARDVDVEGRIATLATQWSRLVEWVHTHYAQLQNALLHWRHFEEEADVLSEWLSQLQREAHEVEERKTREMEQRMLKMEGMTGSNAAETEDEVTQQARLVSEAVSEAVSACLSRYETRWAQLLASLDRRASAVREACGDSIEIQHAVETRVDALVSRWSQLTEPQLDLEENSLTITSRFVIPAMQQPDEAPLREGQPASDGAKRPADGAPSTAPEKRVSLESGRLALMPTGYRAEFESRAEKLLNWLDSRIESLELVTLKAYDEGQEQRATTEPRTSQPSKSPSEVIARIDKELPDAKENRIIVNSLGERYRRDLSQAGENVDELDQLFDDIEERWGLLDQFYKKATAQTVASKAATSDETASQKFPSPSPPPLSERSPHNICRSVESFRQWLTSAKSEATCPINCKDGNNLDDLISNFTRVVQMQPRTAVVEHFLATLEKQEAQELTEEWYQVSNLISERVPVLQNLCENHDLFINQIERFEKLMGDMFDYLDSVAQATNVQPPAIEAQLGESIEALRDMEKMQPTLGHLDDIVEELRSFFSEPYIKKLNERLGELKRTWNRVKELTNENILFLRGKLESAIVSKKAKIEVEEEKSTEDQASGSVASLHSAVQELPITATSGATRNQQPDTVMVRMLDMDELQKWISEAKHRLAKYATIKNHDEMEGFASVLKEFEKELASKRPMIAAIRNGEVTDATGKPVSEKTALLFSGHFADLESEYAAGQERLKSATYHFNDFKSLMSYEKHWLERVDSTIRKSKQKVFVDVGDICDDIMAFENLKSEHSEDDFARLKRIVELLSSERIMSQQLSAEFEAYAIGVTNALKELIQRLEELKKLKERTEEIQIRLDDYESWLNEISKAVQQRMGDSETADSSRGEFLEWCTHIAVMDGVVSNVKRDLAKDLESYSMEARVPDSLVERINSIQVEASNLKRHLLLFTYPSDVRNSIQRCREITREHDVAAINLEIVSLISEHIAGLIMKSVELIDRIQNGQKLIDQLQDKVSSVTPPPELRNANTELIEELRDLHEKNAKILDHVKRFEEGVEKLQPFADRYSQIVDPLEQVMMNVEEVTDYLETADTQNSHIDMLQRVLGELSEVLGREEREPPSTKRSIPDEDKSTLQKLEELLVQIEAKITPTEGLNSTIADVRRVIDKAFAARNAFRAQVNGLVSESNESSATEVTEIRISPQQPATCLESAQKPPARVDVSEAKNGAPEQLLSSLYTRSNQLTSEMVAFFEDLATFNKFCVNLGQSARSQRDKESVEPLQTTIAKSRKKIEVYLNFYEQYFRLQSQYLESRLKDILKAAEELSQEDKKIVLKVQKLWSDSRSNLSWELEQFRQLAELLKTADTALSKYEKLPTNSDRQACLTYITQLEDTYNWNLTQDRVRLEEGEHAEIARRLAASNRSTDLLAKLIPFRECLQQFVTQLNEIQDELHSCQSIPTHELSSQIQSLDQYFILAQEAASKATNSLINCKTGQPPVSVENEGENELLATTLWLDAVLETQKGRLNAYCNEFHLCRPYWQDYANLWQSFMNEAIRQKHQIEMLQLDRPPKEDQGSAEVSVGSARDYAVNLCSSVLTLQRLGNRIVWKAQSGEIGSGLDADLYLQPVFDKHCFRRPLRVESTLQDDITFVNETFDTLVEDLRRLSKKYSIESFLRPNLRIDATGIDDYQAPSKSDSSSDSEGLQETTFPNTQNQKCEDTGITDFEACLNRLKEELSWLQENALYIPIIDTPSNYISKLDGQFWLSPETSGPIRMSSKWVKKKSQELAKLDAILKTHERRSAQLCAISEKVSSSLGDMEAQRQLHEASDELHACMDAARGMIDRRRTRLCDWLSTCTAIEAAMLMDSDGEEVGKEKEQVLPRWIMTIRERLEKSLPNLDSPLCKKELEQLRSEFSPTGNGTGQTLKAVEEAFENYQSDARLSLQSTHRNCVTPQLDAGVVQGIEKSLSEWKSVCRLLRIDQAGQITPQASYVHQASMSSLDTNLETSVQKLAFWLDTVTSYLNSTVACLGGDFNQDAVIAHIKNRVGDRSAYTVRSLYPAVIQIQLQQYAIELDARKPQLDKLAIETERLDEELRNMDNTSTSQLSAMVEEVRQCWNATSAHVKARLEELEKMMTATEELKTLERELDRWLARAETDLANALSNTQDVVERKRIIQEIIDRLPSGETKFTTHQNKCEAILAKYSKEDTQKFRADQEAIQMRWSQLVSRLRESLEGTPQPDSDLIEIPIASRARAPETDLQKIVRLRTVTSQQPGTDIPNGRFLQPESRSMESSMIENCRSGVNNQGPTCSTLGRHSFDQKPPLLGESYRTHQLSRSADIRSRPYDASRPSPRMSLENWPLFLAQLRQMNDWLAHQDANFHQLKGTVGGDSESVSQLINSFSVLEEELRHQRFQVEDLLDRGQMFRRDQLAEGRYGFSTESEGDSDGSEFDPGKSDVDESVMSTKRIVRRIRRHLVYLDKHWAELNRSMLAYRQQLDRAFQKLTVFERVLDDAERELEAAQKVLMAQDPSYPMDERTLQVIGDTFASVTHAIAGLDGQALCLSDDGTIISHVLISRLDGLKIGLERLRSEANEGMNRFPSGNGAGSSALPTVVPVFQQALRSPPQHFLNPNQLESSVSVNGGDAPIPRPKSPSECWLQAFQTVSYPWERCLLPCGNQVPYYKNHATQETQWDHPLMIELLQRMDECNTIRFLAYRTAAKIRQLQLKLFFDQIPLNVATETFARHGLSSPLCSEGCDGRVMDVAQMVNCLTTLYCRVWDTLANQPDVVKTIDANAAVVRSGLSTQQTPTKSCTSESTLAGTIGQQTSMTENASLLESRSRSKKTPTHRSAINCMSSVLCATSNKHSRGDESKSEKGSDGPRQRPATPSVENRPTKESERVSLGEMPPSGMQPSSSYSRVEKLQTRLHLPDGREFALPTCVDLALNLLLNAFDGTRSGTIRVLSFKVTIFLLVNATLDEKYQYLFSLVADRDNKINDSRLWLLVYEILQLPRQLGETSSSNCANNNLDPNILMCFKKNLKTKGGHEHRSSSTIVSAPSLDSQISADSRPDDGELLPSVGLDRFYEWLKLEPPIVAWLPALHRLIAGEKLIHQVRCAVCQACPIKGLRYRCLRCLNFDLCQNCFLIGRVEKSHKITHPIQEYTSTLQRSDSLRDFSRVVRNRFRSKEKFRQSSSNAEDSSKSAATPTTPKAVGRATPTLYDRPPRAVPIRQNSTDQQNATSSPAIWQTNRPASLGETRKHVLYSTPSVGGVDSSMPRLNAKPRRGGSMDQEHELIAQYSHSLRRQNSLTPTGAMMPGGQSLLYYGPQDSVHSLGPPWLYSSATYDRSRPPEPRFFTMRPNQLRGSGGFRANSQPPPHPGPGIYATGPPASAQAKWYRNPSGWEGPMVAGSAGSLDKVLMNLEEENRFLRAEYDRLRMQSPAQNLRPLRSPSLQYPLSQMGLYQDNMYHSAYGNPHFPPNSQLNPQLGYGQPISLLGRSQTERIYPSNNGVFYGGSLGRGSGAAAYSAFLRSTGSGRVTFDSANQRYQSKPSPVTTSQQLAVTPTQESELAQETRLLRQHKTRLESRMQLLEDHNKVLEDQLNRLRQYLNIPPPPHAPPPPTSTNPTSRSVSHSVPGQTYTHENGSIDQQTGSGYTGTQYLSSSDRPSPPSALVAPVNSVGFNQG